MMGWNIIEIICLISAIGIWLVQLYFGVTISRKNGYGIDILDVYVVKRKKEPKLFWRLLGFQLFIFSIFVSIRLMFQ